MLHLATALPPKPLTASSEDLLADCVAYLTKECHVEARSAELSGGLNLQLEFEHEYVTSL